MTDSGVGLWRLVTHEAHSVSSADEFDRPPRDITRRSSLAEDNQSTMSGAGREKKHRNELMLAGGLSDFCAKRCKARLHLCHAMLLGKDLLDGGACGQLGIPLRMLRDRGARSYATAGEGKGCSCEED